MQINWKETRPHTRPQKSFKDNMSLTDIPYRSLYNPVFFYSLACADYCLPFARGFSKQTNKRTNKQQQQQQQNTETSFKVLTGWASKSKLKRLGRRISRGNQNFSPQSRFSPKTNYPTKIFDWKRTKNRLNDIILHASNAPLIIRPTSNVQLSWVELNSRILIDTEAV